MTPAARLQAAIDILDEVFEAIRTAGPAADVIVARYFRSRRYAGSKDRAAVREHVYAALRRAPAAHAATGRKAMLGQNDPALFGLFGADQPHAPAAILPDEQRDAQSWQAQQPDFIASLAADPALLAALQARAPLDLRVNTLQATREEVLEELAIYGGKPTPLSPFGIRFDEPFNIEQHSAYLEGRVDIQDDGSQMVALACHAKPGETVIDLCAGGGGKALALAALMQNQGLIIASDIAAERLSRIAPRAVRLGVETIRLASPKALRAGADVVLVDAPCTGSGTWRRNPEARLRLTEAYLAHMQTLQVEVLDRAAQLVRGGGRITYAVCSWIAAEGDAQVQAFLERQPGYQLRSQQLLRPDVHGCDGFFIACLEKLC